MLVSGAVVFLKVLEATATYFWREKERRRGEGRQVGILSGH